MESSTTISKESTSKWMEMGSILMDVDIVSSAWKHAAADVKTSGGIRLTHVCEEHGGDRTSSLGVL